MPIANAKNPDNTGAQFGPGRPRKKTEVQIGTKDPSHKREGQLRCRLTGREEALIRKTFEAQSDTKVFNDFLVGTLMRGIRPIDDSIVILGDNLGPVLDEISALRNEEKNTLEKLSHLEQRQDLVVQTLRVQTETISYLAKNVDRLSGVMHAILERLSAEMSSAARTDRTGTARRIG